MGPGRHFVYYFVAAGRFVNWVGVAPTATWTLESWTAPGRLDEALADFEGWNPVVRRLDQRGRRPVGRAAPPPSTAGRCTTATRCPLGRGGGHPARRRRPPDAAVHGPGRLPGHGGRGRAGRLPPAGARPGPGAAPLRGPAAGADGRRAARRPAQRDAVPPARRARAEARDRQLAATSGEQTVHRNAWVFGYDVAEAVAPLRAAWKPSGADGADGAGGGGPIGAAAPLETWSGHASISSTTSAWLTEALGRAWPVGPSAYGPGPPDSRR